MISVLIADDQALVRAGFRSLLDAQDDIALIKAADARLYRAKEAGRNCTVGPEAAGT